MPKEYEAIRDKLVKQGTSYDEAQDHAAAIYNSQHPGSPVTGHLDKKKRKKRTASKADSSSGKAIRELY